MIRVSGGTPPLDDVSLAERYMNDACRRFQEDDEVNAKLANAKPVADYVSSADSFAAVYLPGGHGTCIDFPSSVALKNVIEGVYSHGSP